MNLTKNPHGYFAAVSDRFAQPTGPVRGPDDSTTWESWSGLIALYGQGDFSTPPFIYQNF